MSVNPGDEQLQLGTAGQGQDNDHQASDELTVKQQESIDKEVSI